MHISFPFPKLKKKSLTIDSGLYSRAQHTLLAKTGKLRSYPFFFFVILVFACFSHVQSYSTFVYILGALAGNKKALHGVHDSETKVQKQKTKGTDQSI